MSALGWSRLGLGAGNLITGTILGGIGAAKTEQQHKEAMSLNWHNYQQRGRFFDRNMKFQKWIRGAGQTDNLRHKFSAMRDVGINPLLAAGGQPTSSPAISVGTGGTVNSPDAGRGYHEMTRNMSSAFNFMRQKVDIARSEAQTRVLNAQADQSVAQTASITQETGFRAEINKMYAAAQRIKIEAGKLEIFRQQMAYRLDGLKLTLEQKKNIQADLDIIRKEIENQTASENLSITQKDLVIKSAQAYYMDKNRGIAPSPTDPTTFYGMLMRGIGAADEVARHLGQGAVRLFFYLKDKLSNKGKK